MGYASRLLPPSEVARAKSLPLGSVARCDAPVDSTPADQRNALDAALTAWLSQWMRTHGIDEAFLAKSLQVSTTVAGRKVAPRHSPKDRATPFTLVDVGMLNPRLRSQFMFDVGAFFASYDASH